MTRKPEKNQPEENRPEKKKLSFKQRLKEAFNGVSRKELAAIFRDTLKDLRRPQEIGLLVGSSFIPGGWIGYGVYRVAKYRRKKAANDNPEPEPEPKESRPKGPKPPAP
ncbi:MAG: hypothetical protein EPN97_05510 [Alphaproteobacteria bacterium]|nr:MAG: hypothetical protein EPN97_05510 [Alphaproteobacteria bacterium]